MLLRSSAGGGIETGAASGRMLELVLTISEKIFCNINHFFPPDVNDGNWYDTCKQVNFFS